MPYYCPSCYAKMKAMKDSYKLKCPDCERIEDPGNAMMPEIPEW